MCCEAAEGRLNKTSVVLEGSRRDSGGCRIKLDLSDMDGGFALFPGQIIAVEGVNASGHKMVVKRVVEGKCMGQGQASERRGQDDDSTLYE